MVTSRKVPSPSDSKNSKVWLPGRCRFETPCRSRYGQRGLTIRRVRNINPRATAASTAKASANPPTIDSARFQLESFVRASITSRPTSSRYTGMRPPRPPPKVAPPRSVAAGEIRRIFSSGTSAKPQHTAKPAAVVCATTFHSGDGATVIGRLSLKNASVPVCKAIPSPAPNSAPASPSTAACTT